MLRSRSQVARFIEGLELVEPGVPLVRDWHTDSTGEVDLPVYAAVGVKP